METLLPPSSVAEASETLPEQLPRPASCESTGQQGIDSPSSTIPLHEAPSSGSDHGIRPQINDAVSPGDDSHHPLEIEDSADDQLTRYRLQRRKRKREQDEIDNIIFDAAPSSDSRDPVSWLDDRVSKAKQRLAVKDQKIKQLLQQIKDLKQENHALKTRLLKISSICLDSQITEETTAA